MQIDNKEDFKLDMVSIRMVKDSPLLSDKEIHSCKDAMDIIGKYICDFDREVFCVVNLDTSGKPINANIVSVGAINYCVAHPREVLKSTVLSNATSVILLHNHPSGKIIPSKNDIAVTEQLMGIYKMMDINFVDHIVIGRDLSKYYSFKEKGELSDLELLTNLKPSYVLPQIIDNYVDIESRIQASIKGRENRGTISESVSKALDKFSTEELVTYYMKTLNRESMLRGDIESFISGREVERMNYEREQELLEKAAKSSYGTKKIKGKSR